MRKSAGRAAVRLDRRTAGVLFHPTSLPGPFPIGDLGPASRAFLDFLHEARQSWWQMFPLGPPGMGNSPYAVLSAFAGNPLLVSLEDLKTDGWLSAGDLSGAPKTAPGKVDFGAAVEFKLPRLERAHDVFVRKSGPRSAAYRRFCRENAGWLEDYALFCSLKEAHGGASWDRWDADVRRRTPAALRAASERLAERMNFVRFVQYAFDRQVSRLRDEAHGRGVGLIGDVPIFVAHDSADVWANPELFWIDGNGRSLYVAGTPPDYFSQTGQRWGNPLYRWNVLRRNGYAWWIRRFEAVFRTFDAVRLDHFIGFQRYWRIPGGDETAQNGVWVPGPGAPFFETVLRKVGPVQLIAEDLGSLTPEVKALRDRFHFPGMRVLQFAFGTDPEANNYLPHSYIPRCVVYTGTHDNDTTVGWFRDRGSGSSTRSADDIRKERDFVKRYVNSDGREIHWDLIRLALSSVGDTVIIPAQDLLGLGSEARMNLPGTSKGNWEWRMKPGALNRRVANRLLLLTETYARKSRPPKPAT